MRPRLHEVLIDELVSVEGSFLVAFIGVPDPPVTKVCYRDNKRRPRPANADWSQPGLAARLLVPGSAIKRHNFPNIFNFHRLEPAPGVKNGLGVKLVLPKR